MAKMAAASNYKQSAHAKTTTWGLNEYTFHVITKVKCQNQKLTLALHILLQPSVFDRPQVGIALQYTYYNIHTKHTISKIHSKKQICVNVKIKQTLTMYYLSSV